MKAVVCPVCEGEGELFHYTEIVRGEPGTRHMKVCHACHGAGKLVLRDEPTDTEPTYLDMPPPLIQRDNMCPVCGGDRNEQGGTGCGKNHYGTYCVV